MGKSWVVESTRLPMVSSLYDAGIRAPPPAWMSLFIPVSTNLFLTKIIWWHWGVSFLWQGYKDSDFIFPSDSVLPLPATSLLKESDGRRAHITEMSAVSSQQNPRTEAQVQQHSGYAFCQHPVSELGSRAFRSWALDETPQWPNHWVQPRQTSQDCTPRYECLGCWLTETECVVLSHWIVGSFVTQL